MSWFDKLVPSRIRTEGGSKRQVPEGVWSKCGDCSSVLYRAELERNLNVCPKCGHHMRLTARRRLEAFLDSDGRSELGTEVEPTDFLKFKDGKKYRDRIVQAQKASGEKDALIVIKGSLKGVPLVACAFDFIFMAGSMGSVVFSCIPTKNPGSVHGFKPTSRSGSPEVLCRTFPLEAGLRVNGWWSGCP